MPDPNSLKYRRALRSAFDDWVLELNFSWFVTLNINAPANLLSGRRLLRHFGARLDRELLGPRFHKKDIGLRKLFIAVPEHENSNLHYHVLLEINAPGVRTAREVTRLIGRSWSDVIRSGTVWVREIYDEGAAQYTGKDLLRYEHFNEFVISTEFISRG
jgi:hypothetical protein